MALLELLAGAAPAWVIAANLLFLRDAARLDVDGLQELALLAVGSLAERDARGSRREGARLRARAAELEVARPASTRARRERLRRAAVGALDLDLDVEDEARELLPDRLDQGGEHVEALVLVGDERVLLGEAAEVDALAQVVHVVEVLAPALVDDLEQAEALDLAHELGAELLLALVVCGDRVLLELLLEHL